MDGSSPECIGESQEPFWLRGEGQRLIGACFRRAGRSGIDISYFQEQGSSVLLTKEVETPIMHSVPEIPSVVTVRKAASARGKLQGQWGFVQDLLIASSFEGDGMQAEDGEETEGIF